MLGLRFVSVVLALLYVVNVCRGQNLTDVSGNSVPQNRDVSRHIREVDDVNNGPGSSFLVEKLRGDPTDSMKENLMESEDLKRYKRGLKKSAKKGGGGGKGGCKKGRK